MNPATTPSTPTTSTEADATTTSRSSSARSLELGVELRRLRHLSGMSSADTAEALGWSLGKLNKLETGNRRTSPWEVVTLLGYVGADQHTRNRIQSIAEEADTGTFLRLHDRPETTFYVHEAALRMVVGDPAIMHDQLLHPTLMCG